MSEIATQDQLRMSYLRWALVTVPAIVLIGALVNRGYSSRWFAALDRPASMPPDWMFAAITTALYGFLGLALAMVLHARGAKGRSFALLLFFVQLVASFIWSLLFFGSHQVSSALYIVVFALMVAAATAFAFAPIRRPAAWLLLPFIAWLGFAAWFNFQIDQRNPNAETLVPAAASTQIG